MKLSVPTLLAATLAMPCLIAASAVPSLLVPARAEGVKLAFAPAEGSTLTKTFTTKMELTLEDMSMSMNGEPLPVEFDMDMSVNHTQTTVVSDEYAKLREGATAKLLRSFDEMGGTTAMSMQMNVMGNAQEMDKSTESLSELEGKKVVFSWDGESSEYKAAYPEDGGDEDLLENLDEDMDLRVLLPGKEVAEGEEWSIPVSKLKSILAPGGDLKLEPEESGEDGGMGNPMGGMDSGPGDLSDWLGDEIEGTATAKFIGMREVDGVKVALVELKIDIKTAADLTDVVLEAMDGADMPSEMEMDFDHVDIEFSFEAEGTMTWNVAAGHFQTFDLSGRMRLLTDMGMSMSAQGQSMSMEQTLEMAGTLTQSARAE